jgi:formiminotetrahydrofolate cyclodeaminase
MLVDLTVKEFLAKTAGSDPVPGGGSISALNAALAAALSEMVANLTIGKKKYFEVAEQMKEIATASAGFRTSFIEDIDADSDAYNQVFEAFKLPKETEEEKAFRSEKIQEATKTAADIPMQVARNACALMDQIEKAAENGNQNAVTDACVAMMAARTAVLGALLNVRINLGSIKDEAYVEKMTTEAALLEKEAVIREQTLLAKIEL